MLPRRVQKICCAANLSTPTKSSTFEEPLSYYEKVFAEVGLEQVSPYRWRLKDQECTITADVQQSADGYEVWLNVQAVDAHRASAWREAAQAFDAYLLSSFSETRSITRSHTRGLNR